MTKKEIGEKIREFRLRSKLSQEELGKAIGRSHAAISYIESGKSEITITDLLVIAKALNVQVPELIGYNRSKELFTTTFQFQGTTLNEVDYGGYRLNLVCNMQSSSSERQKPELKTFSQGAYKTA